MRRLLLCTVVAALSGCQCFVPVDEPDGGQADGGPPDSGRPDGGSDAGRDAGASSDGGCERAPDCLDPAPATSNWCFTSPGDAGFSCVANECVYECPGSAVGRTCRVNQATYCLECGDAGACPVTGACGGIVSGSAAVENGANCGGTWPNTTIPFTAVTIMRTASAQCRYLVSGDAGQTLGELWRLDDGSYLTYFPGLGGWCTGRSAFTGVPRSIFQCPACQFGLVGFE